MTVNEYKKQLLEKGVKEEELAKVDFAKLESIIDGAKSIEGLCGALKEAFPDFDEAGFKKAVGESSKESEEAQDLSDDALGAVAGGSIGSWIKKNKDILIATALTGLVAGGLIYGTNKVLNAGCSPSTGGSGSAPVDPEKAGLDNFLAPGK